MSHQALAADLRGMITGSVSDDPAVLAGHETDYGQVLRRRPAVVVRPDGPADVAAVLRYAGARGVPVSPRGTGHSVRGQSTNDGGVVLDLNGLDRLVVDPGAMLFRCGPGVRWRTVIAEAGRHGLTPPTLTGYPHVTVGGTHSAGGWGEASFRYGAQVDNCTGLEVVTGTGEVLRCDPEHHPDLFGHVLGGMGQFAVITEVEHRLREYRPVARTYPLSYDSPDALLADLRRLAAAGSPLHSIECTGAPGRGGAWNYRVLATIEAETPPEHCPVPELTGRPGTPSDQPTARFLARPHVPETSAGPGVAQPWVVAFLPWSQVRTYLELIHRVLTGVRAGGESMVRLWPIRRELTATPMARVPDTEPDLMMVDFSPSVPVDKLPAVLALLSRVSDAALELGGTRHLATWVHLDLPRWRLHFGPEWPAVNELKRRYDPAGVLNPGFIEYEPAPAARPATTPGRAARSSAAG
jgi:cytokinin dehydrogenase